MIHNLKGLSNISQMYRQRDLRVRELKSQGKKAIGYFCCHPAAEMLTAADIVPFRLGGSVREPISTADAYVERNTCPFLRSCFDIAFQRWYYFLDGIVVRYMESLGAVIIGEHGYYLGQPSDIELPDPVETLAWRQWERFTEKYHNRAFPNIPKLDARWIAEAKVDGVVWQSNPSCRDGTANIYYRDEIERILQRKIPTIFIESDMIDARTYSEAEAKAKVDAFLEILAAAKEQRKNQAYGER